jgi:hypothetical protein
MVRNQDFDPSVPIPHGLTIAAIKKSVNYIERELADLVEIYFEQKNVFSAIVGIYGTRALDHHSVYEKVRHSEIAQTRFPDLRHRNAPNRSSPEYALESKASKRPWAVQSHYDHEGWYIVWRYLVDPTTQIERAKPVIIWRTDIVYLQKTDWKYEGSRASESGGGRTHTFGVKEPAKRLHGCAVFRRGDIVLSGGKPQHINGD